MKSNKGITLIALVITIIVLLILAGIVIASLTGENGIMSRTTESTLTTKKAEIIERVRIDLMTKKIERQSKNENLTSGDVNAILATYFEEGATVNVYDQSAEMTAIERYKGKEIKATVGEVLGGIIVVENSEEDGVISADQITSDNYGDFIDYGIDISNTDEEHIDGWRIFYSDNNGTYIIAADYVLNTNSYLSNALSAANMGTNSDNNYSGYWPKTSNLTKTAIDTKASVFLNEWTTTTYQNGKAAAALLDTSSWSSFLTEKVSKAGGLAIGGPTVNMFVKSWNARDYGEGKQHSTLYIAPRTDSTPYGYYIGTQENPSTDVAQLHTDEGAKDTLYCPHPGFSNWNNVGGYWLASPGGSYESYVIPVNSFCWIGINGNYQTSYYGIRPVVYLPSSIKLKQDDNGVWQIK